MASNPDPDDLPPKDRLDHLAKLADDRWREYTNKTAAEWKASFGIWVPLTAALGGLLAFPRATSIPASLLGAIEILAYALALLHAGFLTWIQINLAPLRRDMTAIYEERKRILKVSSEQQKRRWPISPLFQFAITAGLLTLIVKALIAAAAKT